MEIPRLVRPIAHEAPGIAVFAFRINRWQPKLHRQVCDAAALIEEHRIGQYEKGRDV